MKSKPKIYTKELLEYAVSISHSFSELGRNLGIDRLRGGQYELITNRIKEFNIDTSHFLNRGVGFKKGNVPLCTKNVEEVLIKNLLYRTSHTTLKRCLLKIGYEYKCSICSLDKWNDKEITLDIDHIDGDWSNCTRENLRFLCPNCHRQTNTFAGKNLKIKKKIKTYKNKEDCIRHKKVTFDKQELYKLLWKMPMTDISKKYNVSDVAIKKWVKKWNLLLPPRGYWLKKKQ